MNIDMLPSAWTGHKDFAIWLVNTVKPQVTVDLGVDYGYSLFALAIPNIGKVYGIDSFEADMHAGSHPDNYQVVMNFIEQNAVTNVEVIKGWFSQIAQTWDQVINILHIDGLHTYDAITEDWNSWADFVPEDGVIIMHDVVSFPELTKFYNEIDYPKAYFSHSAGLGIATKNQKLLDSILETFKNCTKGNISHA